MGYFQSWRYFDSIGDLNLINEIRMKGGGAWFNSTSNLISRSKKPLGIHVRRGDYGVHQKHGMLSSKYYQAALQELRLRGVEWEDVWVFSDQIDSAQSELSNIFDASSNVYYVKPPESSNSLESLFLMSKFSNLIIANSTFSWWAATLGSKKKNIVCPEKWFAEMEDPTDLCPDNWLKVQSDWVEIESTSPTTGSIDSKSGE